MNSDLGGAPVGPAWMQPAVLGEQARESLRRDLACFLPNRHGQWAAYHGDQLLGFAWTEAELVRDCQARGLAPGSWAIGRIEPVAELPQNGVPGEPAELPRLDALGEETMRAFWRDLPQLGEEHEGRWVAYHGSRQVGLADTKSQLAQECLRRGLRRGEYLLCRVNSEPDEVLGGGEPAEEPAADGGS